MKNIKGITLIALVITIIVLLILAGVSLSLVLGENGILNQATNSVTKHNKATTQEEVALAYSSAESAYWDAWSKNTNIDKNTFIKQHITDYLENATVSEGENGNYVVTYGTEDFNITPDGGISEVQAVKGNASEIASTDNIGKAVNYGVTYTGTGSGWEILYADDNNVYIITTGALTAGSLTPATANGSGYSGTSDFINLDTTKYPAIADGWLNKITESNPAYTNENQNMKCTEYLLDSTNPKWSELKNDKAKWVIGAPTLELLVASYNSVKSNKVSIGNLIEKGYTSAFPTSGMLSSITINRPWSHDVNYWLASPTAGGATDWEYLFYVESNDSFVESTDLYSSFAFRPVVCLNSNVVLTWNSETNEYDI